MSQFTISQAEKGVLLDLVNGILPIGAGGAPFGDTVALIRGSADVTKLVRIEADGLTTGTTRVLTMPDADITPDDQSASRTPALHALGGAEHSADTLANLNAKVSDATLDDSSASRTPSGAAGGDLGGIYPNPTVNNVATSVVEASLPVADTTSIVKGSIDATKLVRIEADGLTTGTTRVLTMPDADITPDDASATRGHAVLAGQAGGQTLVGGLAASEDLILRSTVNPAKGDVLIADDGGNVGIGTSTPTKRLDVAGDTRIEGNLIVEGTTITTESETVLIADNHLYLNDGYTTVAAQTGGLVVNYLPTVTADTVAAGGFTAGVAAVSNPTVATVGTATFTTGDLVQVSGSDNGGLYEVLTHAANMLTIRGIGTTGTVEDFTQNQFVTDAVVVGTITKINVAVKRAGTDGLWEAASGSSTGFAFADFQLQAAPLTTGSIPFADLSGRLTQDNANLFWDDALNRLGIGTATPNNPLDIASTETSMRQTRWSNNADSGAGIVIQRSRGATVGDDTVVVSGDKLASINFRGYDGATFIEAAQIRAFVDGVPGVGDMPGRLVFLTTADGVAAATERMRIDSIGNVGIGTDTVVPLAKLHIEEPSTADLLRVRQALSTKFMVRNDGNVGIGTSVPDKKFHVAKAVNGSTTLALFENSQANTAGSTNETAEIRLGFGGNNDVVRIVAGKEQDYTSAANEDSFLAFYTDLNGTAAERMRVDSSGALLFTGSNKKIGATDAGSLYLAPFSNSTTAVQIREADNTEVVFNVDTLNGRVGIENATGVGPQYRLDVGASSYFAINGSFAHIVQHNSAAATFWSIAPRNGGDLDIAVTTTDPRPTGATIAASDNAISIKANKDVDFSGSVTASNLKAHALIENRAPSASTTSDTFVTLQSASAVTFSGRPLLIVVNVTLFPNTATMAVVFAIQIDSGADNVVAQMLLNETEHNCVSGFVVLTPTAGSHTIRLRWRRALGSGAEALVLDANDQILLHAVEL